MEQMLWPSMPGAVPRACYLWPGLPWEPAPLLACAFTQVDGNVLRWLRTEQIPRLPARPLEASLPTSPKMPKLGFWREMEAQRPTCPQGENIFVHSILMRAAWECMGDHAWENSDSSSPSLKRFMWTIQMLWLTVAPPRVAGSSESVLFSLIPPAYGFWEKCLAKGGGHIVFVGLGTFMAFTVTFWSPKSFVLRTSFLEPLLWKTVSMGLKTDIL